MIEIGFRLVATWQSGKPEHGPTEVDDITLRYRAFLGDIVLKIANVDFSASWGWVPVLDFAASLRDIADDLSRGSAEACFEFTESDAALFFRRKGADVCVTCNYGVGEARISVSELLDASRDFAREVRAKAVKDLPELEHSSAFLAMLPAQ